MIIGCCGAGKSTLSRRLKDVVTLPTYHLDQYYWKPYWTETPPNEWKAIVQGIASQDRWLIDGNYGGTMDVRLNRADTVVYLKYSTIRCLWRVIKRIIKYHGQVRPDMPEGCRERFDLEFMHYVATYNLVRSKSIKDKLSKLPDTVNVLVLSNDREVDQWVKSLLSVGK